MAQFNRDVQVRWSDLDPNFHLRHSIYYDWGALCRIEFLQEYGLSTNIMATLHFGPILFREECIFKKEIHLNDKVTIDLELIKSRKDYSRWTFSIQFVKMEIQFPLSSPAMAHGSIPKKESWPFLPEKQ